MATFRSRSFAAITNDENGIPCDKTRKAGIENVQPTRRRNALTVVNENIQRKNAAKKPLAAVKQNAAKTTFGSKHLKDSKSNVQNLKLGSSKFAIFEDTSGKNREDEAAMSLCKKSSNLPPIAESLSLQEPELSSDAILCDSPMVLDTPCEQTKTENTESSIWYLSSVYSKDVYSYLRDLEKEFRPKSNYIRKQPDITSSMRSILVDWLVEVTEEYSMHNETLYLAVSYLDRFLSSMSVMRSKLQLVGTASMFIASKYEEIYPPELKDFVYITDDTYTKNQLLRMEHLILKALSFDLSAPTSNLFLEYFCFTAGIPETVSSLAKYICEMTLLEAEPFLVFLPSMTAASAICLANYTLGRDIWNNQMVKVSGYHLEDFSPCVKCLFERYRSFDEYPQQSVKEKYSSSKYHSVSSIQPPRTFIY